VARESSLEERQRQDREKAEANKARQVRQGVVPAEVSEIDEKPAPKPRKSRARAKK
jgi:hypothetical protein